MKKSIQFATLSQVLSKSEEWIDLDPAQSYQQVTIKLWGQGVVLRNEVSGAEIAASRRLRVKAGQFILSRIDARNGALGLVPQTLHGAVVSNDFPAFDLDTSRILPDYLGWLCKTHDFVELCKAASEGTTNRVRLQEDRFLGLQISLPPLADQRRIVARIEELAAKIEEARGLRREVVEQVELLKQSYYSQVLGGGYRIYATNEAPRLPNSSNSTRRGVQIPQQPNSVAASWPVPTGWNCISIAELLLKGVLLDIKDGNHGENHPKASEFISQGIPFLMASDIGEGNVGWIRAARIGDSTVARLRVGFTKAGDTLFTHKASIGRTAVTDRDCILSPQVTYYRSNPNFINANWLAAFLSSNLFLKQLDDIKGQSTRDYVSISKQYSQYILLPPLVEQQHIVAYLDSLQAKVDALKALQAETAAELEALLPSVLDKAFRGEL